MTLTEAQDDIRSTTRKCKGARVLSEADRTVLFDRYKSVEASRNWKAALTYKRALEKSLNSSDEVVTESDWDGLYRRIAFLFDTRVGCGFDVNDLILSFPLDGAERAEPCPQCGLMLTWLCRYDLD